MCRSNGNVGIGTTTPYAKLQISGTSTNPSTSTQSSTFSHGILRLHGTGGVYMDLGFQSSSPYAGWIQTHNGSTDGVGDDLLLQPVSGNVGIGTTSPDYKLHIANESLNNSIQDLLCLETHVNSQTTIGPGLLFRERWNNGSYFNLARILGMEQGGYGGQLAFLQMKGQVLLMIRY